MTEIDEGTLQQLVKASMQQDEEGEFLNEPLFESKVADYIKFQEQANAADSGISAINQETKDDLGLLNSTRGTFTEAPVRFLKDVGGEAMQTLGGMGDLVDLMNPVAQVEKSLGVKDSYQDQMAGIFGKPDLEDRSLLYKAPVKALGALPAMAFGGGATAAMGSGAGGAITESLGLPAWVGQVVGGGAPSIVKGLMRPISAAETGVSQASDDLINAATKMDVGVRAGGKATGKQVEAAAGQIAKIAESPNMVASKLAGNDSYLANKLQQPLREVLEGQEPKTVQDGVMSVLSSSKVRAAKSLDEAKKVVGELISKTGEKEEGLAKFLAGKKVSIPMQTGEVADELAAIAPSLPAELRATHKFAIAALSDTASKAVDPSIALKDLKSLTALRDAVKSYAQKNPDPKFGSFASKLDFHIDGQREALSDGMSAALDNISEKLIPKEFRGASFDATRNQMTSLFTTKRIFNNIGDRAGTRLNRVTDASQMGAINQQSDRQLLGLKSLYNTGKEFFSGGLSRATGRGEAAINAPMAEMGLLRSLASSPDRLSSAGQVGMSKTPNMGDLASQALRLPGAGVLGAVGGATLLGNEMMGAPEAQAEGMPMSPEEQALALQNDGSQDIGFDPTLQAIGNIDSSTFYDDKVNIPDESLLQEKEQNAAQIGTLPRDLSALIGLSKSGKDLSDLGFSDDIAKDAGALLGGSKDDQRLGMSMLMQDKPSMFEMSPIPGYNSLVDGVVVDLNEKTRIQDKLREVLRGDPARQVQAIEAVRRNQPLPKWSYGILGGEDQMTFEDKFLRSAEAFKTKAYMDTKGNPTIGEGVNLGAQSVEGLRDIGVPEEILQKVSPLIGAKGERAKSILKANPVELSDDEALELSKAVKRSNYEALNEAVKQDIGASLEDLPIEGRTVLISLGYNFGSNLKNNEATKRIWSAAMQNDWGKVQNLLRTTRFSDKNLQSRREKEARLLDPLVDRKMQLAMNQEGVDTPAVDGSETLPDGSKRVTYTY